MKIALSLVLLTLIFGLSLFGKHVDAWGVYAPWFVVMTTSALTVYVAIKRKVLNDWAGNWKFGSFLLGGIGAPIFLGGILFHYTFPTIIFFAEIYVITLLLDKAPSHPKLDGTNKSEVSL